MYILAVGMNQETRDKSKLLNSDYFRLLGQSDAQVSLVKDDKGKICVRKEVPSSQSKKLFAQFQKHNSATKFELMKPISVPLILSDFSRNEYLMEYIAGNPVGKFLEVCDSEELNSIIGQVIEYLERAYCSGGSEISRRDILSFFEKKLIRCISALDNNWLSLKLADEKEALVNMFGERIYLQRWSHGDFSFENLLVTQSSKVNAIDFLDSEIDLIELDWGRIWLDVKFGWWAFANNRTANGEMNLSRFKSALVIKAELIGLSKRELDKFALLAAIRILPYTVKPTRRGHMLFAIDNLVDTLLK